MTDPKKTPPQSDDIAAQDLNARLLDFVRVGLVARGLSHRALERALGYGHGVIGLLMRGQTELRLRQIEDIGTVLGFTLEEALLTALGHSVPPKIVPLGEQFAEQVAHSVVAALSKPVDPRRGCACATSTGAQMPPYTATSETDPPLAR